MPAGVDQQDGIIGGNLGELPVERIAEHIGLRAGIPLFLVPSPPVYPFTRPCLLSGRCHLFDNLIPIFHLQQVDICQQLPHSRKVSVPLYEPRHHKPPLQVENFCIRSDPLFSAGIRSNPNNPVIAYR